MIPRGTVHCARLSTSSLNAKSYTILYSNSVRLSHGAFYSTRPSPSPAENGSTTGEPASPTPSKRKAEFHPPPRKPDAATLASEAQTKPLKPPPTKVPSSSPAAPSKEAIPDSASLIQLAIEDMRKAQQHGILKPPPENAGRVGKLFHQGKELFKFYFRGIKLIWVHGKTVRDIRARVAGEQAAGREPRMTRWESEFVRTYQQDLRKLVPFLLIVLVIEEVIPLVVMYAPGILPSTCILPSQLERIQAKAETTRKGALVALKSALQQPNASNLKQLVPENLRQLDATITKELCRAFGTSAFGPALLARYRLQKHLQYLKSDDVLLDAEGRGIRLSVSELRLALAARGYLSEGVAESALRNHLATWVSKAKSDHDRLRTVLERANR